MICWLVLEQSAAAVVIFERGKPQPTIGRLVSQDERSVVIELEEPGGRTVTREIPRSDIEDMLIAVSEERLSTLRPDDPAAYRNYAEELAVKRKDPDALLASLRLYLIAAYLAPDTLGHSSLLGMIALARNPSEERRFRAMAFLLDPNHDRRVLTSHEGGAIGADDAGRAGLLKAIQAMRRGQRRTAMQWIERQPVRSEFEKYQDLINLEQFQSLENEIPPQILRRLLTLEWILTRDGDEGESPMIDRRTSWSQTAGRQELDPMASLRLETLTEFDPRQCIYDQGRWIRPEH